VKLCKVVGAVVCTIKKADLKEHRLLLVRELGKRSAETIVAVDLVGVGAGQEVLVTFGTAARVASGNPSSSADAAIVGLVDEDGSPLTAR